MHTTRVLVGRIRVEGDSMRPTLEPGDRLVCVPPWRLRAGDVVALRDPRDGRLLVKRVVAIDASGVTVAGDNPGASTDSRTFGVVGRDRVIGRAVWRYRPEARRGRLRA